VQRERQPSSIVPVQFRDCDPYGHLHNSAYLDYAIEARTEHIATHYGVDYTRWNATTGLAMVVTANDARYVRPVRVGARLRIVTQIIRCDRKRVTIEARLSDAASGTLAAVVWTTLRFVTIRDGAGAECDDALFTLFGELLLPVDAANIDARVRALRDEVALATTA
jgi:acyl-CoA thioester hydrolase